MIRNLKAIGLAFAAVFAVSAVGASAAQAAADFAAAEYPAALTAEADPGAVAQTFQVNPGTLVCQEVSGDGTIEEEGPSLTATDITYSSCLFNGSIPFTPNFNGCDYKFHAGNMIGANTSEGTVDIVCPTGKVIEIGIGGLCLVKVGPQNGLGSVVYHNEEGGHVTIDANIKEKISYSYSGLFCGSGSPKNGSYTGKVTVAGSSELSVTGT